MSQPQKTGTPAAPAKPVTPMRACQVPDPDHSLTFAVFTTTELAELWKICRDADNDRHAKQILGDALARAEGKS